MFSSEEEIKEWRKLLENGQIDEETYYKEVQKITGNFVYKSHSDIKKENSFIKKVIIWIFLILIILFIINILKINKPIMQIQSLKNIQEPIQTSITGGTLKIVDGKEIKINYIASYVLCGRVVDVQNYYGSSLQNQLSPLDVGISWGFLANDNEKVTWTSNGTRFLRWRTKDMTWYNQHGGEKGIGKYWSNNHLIPSDDNIEKLIKNIKKDDYIKIEGYLVNIRYDGQNGDWYRWNSSTTRNDTGDGACEVIYVTGVTWLEEQK